MSISVSPPPATALGTTSDIDIDEIVATDITLDGTDGLIITSNGGKDTIALSNTTADVGITIGADTNLYRSAANTLKTDDDFEARFLGVASADWAIKDTGSTGANKERLYFNTNGHTYVKSGGGNVVLRSGGDTDGAILSPTKFSVVNELEVDGDLNHDGSNVGFYGTAPVAKPTGVAVTAEGIHAALVTLGLIAA